MNIHDLLEYNKELLTNEYYHICNNDPTNYVCRKVSENTLDNWKKYLDNNQFSKGKDALDTWLCINREDPFIYIKNNPMYASIPPKPYQYLTELKSIKKDEFYFILAGLMIVFQVFGDGNHRTANYFYKIMTNKDIKHKQFQKINEIFREYDFGIIERDPQVIRDIILRLQQQSAGKKRNKTIRISKRKYKTKKRKLYIR